MTTTTPLHHATATTALHHTTSSSCGEVTAATIATTPKTQLQPPFGPSVDSLCHPWFTATNLSYRFPIFETSATALCGTTGTAQYIGDYNNPIEESLLASHIPKRAKPMCTFETALEPPLYPPQWLWSSPDRGDSYMNWLFWVYIIRSCAVYRCIACVVAGNGLSIRYILGDLGYIGYTLGCIGIGIEVL